MEPRTTPSLSLLDHQTYHHLLGEQELQWSEQGPAPSGHELEHGRSLCTILHGMHPRLYGLRDVRAPLQPSDT